MQLSDHAQLEHLWQQEHMEFSYEYLESVLKRNPETCFVYEIDGQIVSAVCGLYDGRRGFLQSVVTRQEERGKGYATATIQATIEALKALGTNRIRLFVVKENTHALELYQRLGFEIHDYVHFMGLK